jgi:CubicO group peptidase (beta-lactamase class C family)
MTANAIDPTSNSQGSCDSRFSPLRDVFAESFRENKEIGASFAVWAGGRLVVDLWGGFADPARSRPWQSDTLVNLYSTTKGMTALCALRLVERGQLDLDAPVTRYWPEFGQAGKQDVPVRWLLSHRVGLPAVREALPPETQYDWKGMCAALAAEEPWWEPGSDVGYHPITFGWLVGELVCRVDGRSLGTFFREEIAQPLGAELFIGLPEAEQGRCADITSVEPPPELLASFAPGAEPSMLGLAFMNPLGTGDHNSPQFRAAEIPAINGQGNARALATIYGALANAEDNGGSVLTPKTRDLARSEQAHGIDRVMELPMRMGLGFWLGQLDQPNMAFGPNPEAFGHPGAGGSLGFADPEAGIAFGYTPNRLGTDLRVDARPQALIDTLYALI